MTLRPLRGLLPREHGLSAWVLVPLVGALALAPATLPAALAVWVAFGAFNAARRGQRWLAAGAAGLAMALGLVGLVGSQRPLLMGVALALAGIGAAGAMLRFGRSMPRSVAPELLAIGGLGVLGASLAVACGAEPDRAAALAALLFSFQVTGLWWVRRGLARVLPGRRPWAAGPYVALLFVALAAGLGLGLGQPRVLALLTLLPLRLLTDRAPSSAREAPRVGLTELGWTLGVACLGVAL